MTDGDRTPYTAPQVDQRATKPSGILPKHAHGLVIGGVSLVMVIVIAFAGRNTPKERTVTQGQNESVVDPNDERIREYRLRIEQQAQKLAQEQARLAQDKHALSPAAGGISGRVAGYSDGTFEAVPSGDYSAPTAPDDDSRWMARDRAKREYESRYASNIALTHRDRSGPGPGHQSPAEITDAAANEPVPAAKTPSNVDPALRQAAGKTYRLMEGTVLETVLTNRLDGSFSGPVNCMVTTNVYSHDRMKLLMPQGSRVLGEVSRVEAFGQQRLAVAFHRVVMPDGFSVSLDTLPGLSAAGETGLMDQINHHYLQVFGVSIAIGAIAGLSQANTQYGSSASPEDAYRQGVASSLSQSSLNILNRYLNVLPTFTIREGHRIKVYLTADLEVPAYENHKVPSDL